jgi:hypothetical protein
MAPNVVRESGAAAEVSPRIAPRFTIEPLGRLRAVVLLAGTVRPSQLSRSIGRSLLDLPVRAGLTVLDLWQGESESLARHAELQPLPVRIMLDQKSPLPCTAPGAGDWARVSIERDPAAFRGTGGVLRDICLGYEHDDVVLVANAGQILVEPLPRLARELSDAGGDVALIAHRDGTPGGLMLVRCGVLAAVRPVGFLDFKEQVLPELALRGHEIRIVRRGRATGVPVRTRDGYIAALRAYHRLQAGRSALSDPLQEDWRPTFAVVEERASVDADATVHDSVVMSGGRVERGAVVVRSVVCPGGVARAGSTVADVVIAGHRERVNGGEA